MTSLAPKTNQTPQTLTTTRLNTHTKKKKKQIEEYRADLGFCLVLFCTRLELVCSDLSLKMKQITIFDHQRVAETNFDTNEIEGRGGK
jgi:formate hydrogenlyase subunit 6/NADH:ubiquinone oxidoreductase subunit I